MKFEPNMVDYYSETPECFKTIEKMNNEYDKLEDKHAKLMNEYNMVKKELEFYQSAFKYPHNGSAIFNLVRVKKDGIDIWIDRVKISEMELRELDKCDKVKYLLEHCNPRCER